MDKRVCPQMPKEFQKDCVAYLHKTLPQVCMIRGKKTGKNSGGEKEKNKKRRENKGSPYTG